MLDITPGELQAIPMDVGPGGTCKMFFRAVLVKWAETHRRPYTWQTILDALSSPYVGQASLARDIQHQLVTGDVVQSPIEGTGNISAHNIYT